MRPLLSSHAARRLALAAAPLALAAAALLPGCGGDSPSNPPPTHMLYTENNLVAGNSIQAYRYDSAGHLTLFGTYATGGKGISDITPMPDGVMDSDQEEIVNPQHTRLYAVNQGSDTISVFQINTDGSLTLLGSPVPSGGSVPDTLGLSGNIMVVANKGLDPSRGLLGANANYTTFQVGSSGGLTPIAGSTQVVTLPPGATAPPGTVASQALISPNGRVVFGAEPFGFQLRSFALNANGTLTPGPNSPQSISPAMYFQPLPALGPNEPPPIPAPLGLAVHPNAAQRFVYASLVLAHSLMVFSYDDAGTLTFVRSVLNPGAGSCWLATNHAGTWLYSADTLTDQVTAFDIGTDPSNPRVIQNPPVTLGGAGNPFQLQVSPDDSLLFVLNPVILTTTPIPAGQTGNTIESFRIAADGSLTETSTPSTGVPVYSTTPPAGSAPTGLAVL